MHATITYNELISLPFYKKHQFDSLMTILLNGIHRLVKEYAMSNQADEFRIDVGEYESHTSFPMTWSKASLDQLREVFLRNGYSFDDIYIDYDHVKIDVRNIHKQ